MSIIKNHILYYQYEELDEKINKYTTPLYTTIGPNSTLVNKIGEIAVENMGNNNNATLNYTTPTNINTYAYIFSSFQYNGLSNIIYTTNLGVTDISNYKIKQTIYDQSKKIIEIQFFTLI